MSITHTEQIAGDNTEMFDVSSRAWNREHTIGDDSIGVDKLEYPVNQLSGVTPTASVWTVDPTNLARCTDDDWVTATGTGNKVVGGADYFGQLDFDMGAVYNVEVRGIVGLGNNIGGGSNTMIGLEYSLDDITYSKWGNNYSWAVFDWIANTTADYAIGACFIRARYIRLRWFVNAAGTGYGYVKELQAIDVGL